VVAAWEGLAMPVLQAIGDRWQSTGEGVDVEHAFTQAWLGVLSGVTATLEKPRNTWPVLLSCAEQEQHSIPLHVLAAALAEIGVGCRMLGENMPPEALIAAVRRTGPGVVFVYARLPVADADVVEQLPRQRPAPRVVLGGPGWDAVRLPGAVLRVDTLGSAVGEVVSGVHL
jgi:methanogenic corrinoid protein MtbC1